MEAGTRGSAAREWKLASRDQGLGCRERGRGCGVRRRAAQSSGIGGAGCAVPGNESGWSYVS